MAHSFRLAIVGGGPSATYAMERLAGTVAEMDAPLALEVHVFERTGRLGDGQTHSASQPATSFLNRIVGQVSFAADPTVAGAGPLLDPDLRPTLYEWCRRMYERTGDPEFDVTPESWPKRYVHGLALRDCFSNYVDILSRQPGVEVRLHHDEVVDVRDTGACLELRTAHHETVVADHILFVTGHSANTPYAFPRTRSWAEFADRSTARFVSSAYPLEDQLTPEHVGPDETVGCVGMGLTAIDVILFLTEGRGGSFEHSNNGRLTYRKSGAEPRSIVACSESGMFTFARPYNAKERDPARLEHSGVFLTTKAVDRLRAAFGSPQTIGDDVRYQLDFERHLRPLVLLEMAYLYYRTLLGDEFGTALEHRVHSRYEAFLEGAEGPYDDPEWLTRPVEELVDESQSVLDDLFAGRASWTEAEGRCPGDWRLEPTVRRYLCVVFGPDQVDPILDALQQPGHAGTAGFGSPWRHGQYLVENRFSWTRTIEPLGALSAGTTPEAYREALLDFMDRDHLFAAQNNLENPAKAAADGVWRDLRQILAYAIDFGGLAADSHRKFIDAYMRHHNRLCNGAALEVMEKIRALVECGLVDVSVGAGARIESDADLGRFRATGPTTGAVREIDVLVDCRVHPFDPEHDVRPLYPNMLRRGLIRRWRNPSAAGGFEPGGLDLDGRFHPVDAQGRIDHRLTFLGPPSEGVMFFQLGALRPHQNHHVMQDVLSWLGDFRAALRERRAGEGTLEDERSVAEATNRG